MKGEGKRRTRREERGGRRRKEEKEGRRRKEGSTNLTRFFFRILGNNFNNGLQNFGQIREPREPHVHVHGFCAHRVPAK
jgi:hypothetical protein